MAYQISELYLRYPELQGQKGIIFKAYALMLEAALNGGTIFICGNGGSAADAEHMAGELLKSFLIRRMADQAFKKKLSEKFGNEGAEIAGKIHPGVKAITLTGQTAFSTAYVNDVDAETVFAQQIYVMGGLEDLLVAFSTSGNSKNIVKAIMVASGIGMKTLVFTGKNGGEAAKIADCCIKVPETETYKIQEYHLPVYHALCAMLEEELYGGKA